jgi:hypothetical protein
MATSSPRTRTVHTGTNGLPITSTSAEAVALYERAGDQASDYALATLARALELDPGFALAHTAAAIRLKFADQLADARISIERARQFAGDCSTRERQFVAIFAVRLRLTAPAVRQTLRYCRYAYSTSRIISISTGMPMGSSAMPTAERACLPICSPKTSTIKSEKPLMT